MKNLNELFAKLRYEAESRRADTPEEASEIKPERVSADAVNCAMSRSISLLTLLQADRDTDGFGMTDEHVANVVWTVQGQLEQAQAMFKILMQREA